MKKILTAVALATLALSASATGLVVEYDWNHYQGKPAGANHNTYGYVGLIQSTRFGTFDAGLQTSRTYTAGFGVDRANGYEVGYSYPLQYGQFTVTPRIGFGSMANINPAGTGYDVHARYYEPSVEVAYPLTSKLGSFVSFAHMNGISAGATPATNRFEAGVDYKLAPAFSVRTAYSYRNGSPFNKFNNGPQSGVALTGTYSF